MEALYSTMYGMPVLLYLGHIHHTWVRVRGVRGTYGMYQPARTTSVRKCNERSCMLINTGTSLIFRDSGMFHWRYLVLVPGTCHMHHKHDTPAFTLDPA